MREVLSTIVLFLIPLANIGAQDTFIIVSIEEKNKAGIHPIKIDHWLININDWTNPSETGLVPLFIDNFSDQDIGECQDKSTLTFFNKSTEESYTMIDSLTAFYAQIFAGKELISVTKNRKKGNKIIKRVYFTYVIGTFLFCHAKNISFYREGYCDDLIALPMSLSPAKGDLPIIKKIKTYPFFRLPVVGLSYLE